MKRAAVIIGVDRTGGLPELNDAARGAKRVADEWAAGQGFATVDLLTDANGGKVTLHDIKEKVRLAIDSGAEQLVVYFAGHGINRNRDEYWLLSDAPDDPNEAVNAKGSWNFALTCGARHVVMISDCCRTTTGAFLHSGVNGGEIFPNRSNADEGKVDQYFACALGMPANEAADVKTREFRALYTDLLVPALGGKVARLLEFGVEDGQPAGFVRPQPLADHLREAMLEKLSEPQFGGKVVQEPNERILSKEKDNVWISMIAGAQPQPAAPARAPMSRGAPAIDDSEIEISRPTRGPRLQRQPQQPPRRRRQSNAAVSTALITTAIKQPGNLQGALRGAVDSDALVAPALVRSARQAGEPFGPTHQESRCGFKVRGSALVTAIALQARTEMTRVPADVVRVWDLKRIATPVLLVFVDGSGVVLPAIRDYLCGMTFEGGDLVDVAYEPSEYTPRWEDFKYQAAEIRALRGIVAAASRSGVFRLEGENSEGLARRMQMMKAYDPSLAVYAAYAYYELRRLDLLREMDGYLRRPWEVGGYESSLFDVAMLAKPRSQKMPPKEQTMFGFSPLLSQGWSLLDSLGVKLPPGMADLPATLRDSVWTTFNPRGVEILRANMFGGNS